MQNTACGTYQNGQIFFDIPSPATGESREHGIFLDEVTKKNSFMNIFDVLGSWGDDRNIETIIADRNRKG